MKNPVIYRLAALIIFLGTIIYVSVGYTVRAEKKGKIKTVEIGGCELLNASKYYAFARLNEPETYIHLTPQLIRDRLAKHPYVKVADIKYTGKGEYFVNISEKEIKALVASEGKNYLITENFETLPLLPGTMVLDFPLINNPGCEINAVPGRNYARTKGMEKAFSLLDAASIYDRRFYMNLSEIDMGNGKGIKVYMTDLTCPAYLGNKDEIKKMLYFGSLWEKLNIKSTNKMVDYVDLRFDKMVYLGLASSETGGERS